MAQPSDNPERILLGAQGFAYKDWVGVFYPETLAPSEYLSFYARVFHTLELDTTFYGPPKPATVGAWFASTPADFIFSAKLPRTITHEKRLVNAERDLVDFLTTMSLLDHKLGPILIQLPPSFSRAEARSLSAFASLLPDEFRYAVELRHRSWLVPETERMLRDHGLAWATIDLPYMPRQARLTADFAYVRWLGNRADVKRLNKVIIDRSEDVAYWAETLDRISRKLTRVYGYVNNHYAGHSPVTANQLKTALGMTSIDPSELWPNRQLTLDAGVTA